jgi:hypothetical protein
MITDVVGGMNELEECNKVMSYRSVHFPAPAVGSISYRCKAVMGSLKDVRIPQRVRRDCEVRDSGLVVGVAVNWSPWFMPRRNTVGGDSDVLCIRSSTCQRSASGTIEHRGWTHIIFQIYFQIRFGIRWFAEAEKLGV